MKRIFLSAFSILALLSLRAQKTADTTGFSARKLKLEEVNIVSSYYSQDGDRAAVTGGIGSQQLTDIATTIDVRLTRLDKKLRKHTLDGEIGIDHYTSASSDNVDLKANSSASHADTRIYPSLTWTIENSVKGHSLQFGASASAEFDYRSIGFTAGFSKKTTNKNGEFSAKAQVLLDRVSLILPTELRTNPGQDDDEDDYPGVNRNTYVGSLSWTQVVNTRFQFAVLADVVQQNGYLSMPFYRVYFTNGSVKQEHLPDSRFKLPIGLRANYFFGNKVILRSYYRFYTDSWGLRSHTASLEIPVKINPFFSVSPFYRFYTQSGVDYFKPYQMHSTQDTYYTSNYDLSKFHSNFFGAGIRYTPLKGVFGLKHIPALELRYGHYNKNIQLSANSITIQLTVK